MSSQTPILLNCTPSEVELAWAAGLIDGEGCIHITNVAPQLKCKQQTRRYSLYLRVSMGHMPTLLRLAQIFGSGPIHEVKPTNPKHNLAWVWCVSSHNALSVLELIRPYMVTKLEEADLAIEFMNLPLSPRGGSCGSRKVPSDILEKRHELWDKVRRLKPSFNIRELKEKAL